MPMLLVEAIWRSCNGREAKAVPGMNRHTLGQLQEAIWRSYNGRKAKAVPGAGGLVIKKQYATKLHVEAIWKCYNGREAKAIPGMIRHVPMLQREAIWRCSSGHEAKDVPGMNGIHKYAPKLLVEAI